MWSRRSIVFHGTRHQAATSDWIRALLRESKRWLEELQPEDKSKTILHISERLPTKTAAEFMEEISIDRDHL